MTEFKKVSGSLEIVRTACLANQIFGQHFSQFMPRPQIDYILDSYNSFKTINDRINTGGYNYYFINSDNRQVGFFAYCSRLGDTFEITEIGMIKKQRGKGNAKKALKFIREQAEAAGQRTLKIKVDKKNETAVKAFTALGFEEIGEEQEKLSGDYFVEKAVLALNLEKHKDDEELADV